MTTLQWVFALALIPGSIISLILVMIIFPESVMEKLSPLGHIGFTILAGPIWWIMLTFATVYVVLKTLYRTFKTSKGLSIMDRLLASCREAAAVLFLSERAQRNRASPRRGPFRRPPPPPEATTPPKREENIDFTRNIKVDKPVIIKTRWNLWKKK